MAETYFEILPDDEIEMPELAEVLKSLDEVIKTNRAYNESRVPEEFDEEEFNQMMEKIKNRDSRDPEADNALKDMAVNREDMDQELDSYEEINSILNKRNGERSNSDGKIKNSSVSFSLIDRHSEYLPPPIYLCESGGKVVVSITVDRAGNVLDAVFNSASTSKNQCLIDHAIEYALNSKFSYHPDKTRQLGTITFIFQGKS